MNIKGAAIGTTVAYSVSAWLNYVAVKKYTNIKLDTKRTVLMPVISALIMGVIVLGSFKIAINITSSNMATAISILIGGISYLVLLVLTKGLIYEDFETIPKGESIAKILIKIKLLKRQ